MGNHKGCPYPPQRQRQNPNFVIPRSRGIHDSNMDAATTRSMTACVGHRCPPSPTPFPVIPHSSLTPHHGQPQGLPLPPSKTAAEPKLRHSVRSRGIHVPLHSNDCDYAQHDGVCRATLPPSPTPFPVIPHSLPLIMGPQGLPLHPSKTAAEPKLRHSVRSRGIHVPLHSNKDAATTRSMTACANAAPHHPTIPRHSSLLIMGNHKGCTPLKDSGPKLRHSVRSRGIHVPLSLQHRCCDYAQHDACAGQRCPPSPTPFPVPHSSPIIMGNHKGCPYTPQRQRQNPNSVIPRAVAESMFPCTPRLRSMTACVGQRCPHHPHHSPSYIPPPS